MVKRTVVEQDGNVRIVTEEDEHYIKITQEELVGVITKNDPKIVGYHQWQESNHMVLSKKDLLKIVQNTKFNLK